MKFYCGKWWFGVEWKKHETYDIYIRYFYPFTYIKRKEDRYWGYREDWYDGPLPSFGFWFFLVSWGY
jgi:hypothetical protein